MIKRGTQFFITLMLILIAAGCTPAGELEQTAAGSKAVEGSEQAAAAGTPVATLEQALPVNTAAAEPEQPSAVNTPVDTVEPLSGDDAGQIYAAAIRQMYSFNFSFGEAGETRVFSGCSPASQLTVLAI